MDQTKLKEILESHRLWLNGDPKGIRADLYGAHLSGAHLSGANLSGAHLSHANLSCANLYGADLYGADLYGAHLYGAHLYGANLSCANLYGANLYGANLSGAHLSGADLSHANLSGANLSDALNLKEAKGIFPVLNDGNILVYKKLQNGAICTLNISKDAKRVNAYGERKCRVEFATVVSIEKNGVEVEFEFGLHDPNFKYQVNSVVFPDKFDESPFVTCSHGIHCYATKQEAIDHV